MGLEKPSPTDSHSEIVEPATEKPPEPPTGLPEPPPSEGSKPYLDFSDSEIEKVKAARLKAAAAHGEDIKSEQLEFPTEQETVEKLIVFHPEYFEAKHLAEVAINNSDSVPRLTRELIGRNEYGQLEQILQHYKGKPVFEYCTEAIEAGLKGNELQDSVLMALSEAMAKTEARPEPGTIAEHQDAMMKDKKTNRPLSEYQRLLQLSDEDLVALSGKELLMVGGGFSPIKDGLRKKGIECTVTNIDPMTEPDEKIADNTVKGDFFDTTLEKGKYDEIMALHSLPTYALRPEQVKDFYGRSILSLKPNGILRVMPISKSSDALSPSMRLSRKPVSNASAAFIERLKSRPDLFFVTDFSTSHKDMFGRDTPIPGANIKVIGDEDQVSEFLELTK